VPLERGEHRSAFVGLVTVVEHEAGHAVSLTPCGRPDIRGTP
jgi:hypothetical protein